MPPNKALAMMRDAHLAWDQVRKIRRYVHIRINFENKWQYLIYHKKLFSTCISSCHMLYYPFFSYMPTPTISSERAMRRSQKELLKNYVEGEMVALQFSSSKADAIAGYILQDAPFVRINDVCTMTFDYLDRLDL